MRVLCIFGRRTFCHHQVDVEETNVSISQFYRVCSSAESEINSLDAALRMDGIPALGLWDVVIEMLRSSNFALDDHHFKKDELETVGELSKVCSQIDVKKLVGTKC